ncbi:hypothetical protein BKA62DRAFT_684396 [Auriculariales sp. MPI-PUGE-AT-0066]|nr:hypothetical protein BKA62DRAFT_684396 [Auriculariales sp. MPI-PUGE-AT-0066]
MSSNSGTTAQDGSWKSREQGAEAQYARDKEQQQLAALAADIKKRDSAPRNDEIEGGYGGQESLEDRYATTSGEH